MASCIRRLLLGLLTCLMVSCASDPLAGWSQYGMEHYQPEQTITEDYQNFIQKLPPDSHIFSVTFYGDGTGRHAVEIVSVPYAGVYKHYVLEYSQLGKRTRVRTFKKVNNWI